MLEVLCVGSVGAFVPISHIQVSIAGKLIVSRYVAESITTDAGRFGHVGLCQLRTNLKTQQCEASYKQTLTNGAM